VVIAVSLDVTLFVEVDTGGPEPREFAVFDANVTHNLNRIAPAAGIYDYVWRPDEHPDVSTAGDLIGPLRLGIERMEMDPQRFI
jgi:hypothetical protein